MDQVSCRLEIPEIEGLKSQEMTVGRHAFLNCEGSWDKAFDFSKAQVKLEDSQKYQIKILKAEARTVNSFELDLTSYVAGPITFPEMILTDGTNEISLGKLSFQVQTVIEKTKDGQPPKPFGYAFPLELQWPVLYTILFVSAVVLFLIGLIYQLQRAARFARLIADIQNYNSPISADLQFYKNLRVLEKQNYPLDEVEKTFRLYVLRSFEVPMFILSNRQINQFFKKRKSIFKNERLQVDKFLSEFEELQKNKKEVSTPEKLELINKLYRFVERTQQIRKTP